MCIVLPVQFKKKDGASDLDGAIVTVNNFFVHWLKDIDEKRYHVDIQILPTNNTMDIYRYSAQMLSYLPAKSLGTLKETLFYDKQKLCSLAIETED